jgi:WD40 repeat protein
MKTPILPLALLLLALASATVRAQVSTSLAFQSVDNMVWAAYSSNNTYLVTAAKDSISVWSGMTKVLYARIKAHTKKVLYVTFSPDGKYLISCGDDKLIKVWETDTYKLIKTLTGHLAPVNMVQVSKDNRTLASVSDDTSLKLWDLETGQTVRSFYGHQAKLNCVTFSPDDKYIATAGEDKVIVVQEKATGNIYNKITAHQAAVRSLAYSPDGKTIVSGGDGKYLVFADVHENKPSQTVFGFSEPIVDVKYMSSGKYLLVSSADKNIHVIGADSTHAILKSFKDTKGSLAGVAISTDGNEMLVISSSRWKERLKIIAEFNEKKQESPEKTEVVVIDNKNDSSPPQIMLVSPKDRNGKISHRSETIGLKVKVVDESGVFKASVNGQAVKLTREGMFEINLPLAMGENRLVVEAADPQSNISRKELVITREEGDDSDVDFDPASAKNYLLVIGIDNYKFWSPLSNAVNDATEVKEVLTNKYTFTDTEVITLFNEQATRQNIYASFRELAGKMQGNDNLVIYYSGHGYYDAAMNEGYWVPVDAPAQSEGDYFANAYMLNLLKRVNAKHIFLVADACFSGSLFAEAHRGFYENVEQYKSRWGLTSGRLEFVSDGQVGANSPFARAFLSYLKNNTQEKFSVTQLIQHVKVEVANATNQTPIGNPINSIGHEGGEFIFYKRK